MWVDSLSEVLQAALVLAAGIKLAMFVQFQTAQPTAILKDSLSPERCVLQAGSA